MSLENLEKVVPYSFEPVELKYHEEKKGLVSIIIPIYNAKHYIKETLDSVLAQTFENWEAILVDDDSTDNSSQICIEYTNMDSRFKYIHKENGGTLLARKTGLENSTGEFIANLDNDDAYPPNFLEKMVEKIKEGNNDFVWCDIKDLTGKITFDSTSNNKFSDDNLKTATNFQKSFGFPLWNKLIKRSVYAKIVFPQTYVVSNEDTIQLLQIISNSKRAEFVSSTFSLYRHRDIVTGARKLSLSQEKRRYAAATSSAVAVYLLIKKIFGDCEANKYLGSTDIFLGFAAYFFLSPQDIKHHKLDYIKFFIPCFLAGLKNENKYNKIVKYALVLACYGVLIPFIIIGYLTPTLKKNKFARLLYYKQIRI